MSYKTVRVSSAKVFNICLSNLREPFFDKLAALKQKSYISNGLIKPQILSVKQMTSRVLVLNSYLTKFPEPEKKDFTAGEII